MLNVFFFLSVLNVLIVALLSQEVYIVCNERFLTLIYCVYPEPNSEVICGGGSHSVHSL